MIWIFAFILVLSISLNLIFLRILKGRQQQKQTNEIMSGLYEVIAKISKSGSSLPDLSIDLTSLAATNLSAVARFKDSTSDLQQMLEESTSHFNEVGTLGRQNVSTIEERINALQEFIRSIEELEKYHQSVADAVKILEEISSQTSILALNASVEAARAGDRGKGFSVIAKSVRDLATKSMESSELIKSVIQQSRLESQKISSKAVESSEALKMIHQDINQILDSLKEGLLTFEDHTKISNAISSTAGELNTAAAQNLLAIRDSSQISIRFGMYLDDLLVETNFKQERGDFSEQYIKPKHVFHFNLTNTFPSLQEANKGSQQDFEFPKQKDQRIAPKDVYFRLLEVIKLVDRSIMVDKSSFRERKENIQPVDVLKLSVLFSEIVRKKWGTAVLDRADLIKYEFWRKDREITPCSVLALIDHFHKLIRP